jgi:superfamily II RNA helicase
MTTEILRNLLYKKGSSTEHLGITASISLDNVDAVIFDECHYMNDKDRGMIWEETMILLPNSINMVMLSATLDHPEYVGEWLGQLKKKPVHLIETNYRIVPLSHHVITQDPTGEYNITTLMDAKEVYYDKVYTDWLRARKALSSAVDKQKQEIKEGKKPKAPLHLDSFTYQLNQTITMLEQKELLPAICFVLSRKGCEQYAKRVEKDLLSSSDTAAVKHIITFHLHRHLPELETIPQYHDIYTLLCRGIAYHHSGLLPLLKEIVEILFSKGLVKLLFCTETFAVGLNMPTKTVLFTDIFKHDKDGKRMLYSHEFIQMSGRAGRRGLDTQGYVVLLPQIFTESLDKISFKNLMQGNPQTIKSKFYVDENLILDSVRKNSLDLAKIEDFVKKTLMNSELDKEKLYLDNKLSDLDKKIKGYVFKNYEIFEEKEAIVRELNDPIQPSNNQRKKLLGRLKEIEGSEDFKLEASNYMSFTDVSKNFIKVKNERENLDVFIKHDIESKLRFLTKYEYFDEKVLTLKGNIALLFRELDGVMGAELIFSEFVDVLDENQYLSLLVLSTEGRDIDSEIPKDTVDIICFVNEMFPNHVPNREYVNPIRDWYDGKHISDIINQYKIFEGDLIKNINRIINYIEEINEGYIMKNNLSKVEMLNKIKDRLQREIVSTESLYLRL